MTDITLCIGCSTSRGIPLCPVCEMQLILSDTPIAAPPTAAVSAVDPMILPRSSGSTAVSDFAGRVEQATRDNLAGPTPLLRSGETPVSGASSCGGDSSPDLESSGIDDDTTFGGSQTTAAPRSRRAGIASGPQDSFLESSSAVERGSVKASVAGSNPASSANSVAAKDDRSAPALAGVSLLTSATPGPSSVLRAGSGVADFSDVDSVIADLERVWLAIPGAAAIRMNTIASRTLAASASASNSNPSLGA